MVVDTSAFVAIMRHEPEEEAFARLIAKTNSCLLSAVSLHETCLVLAGRRRDEDDWRVLDAFVESASFEVVPFDVQLAHLARDAFLRFGKGRHPAALNLADCASYALAKQRGAPLLYKGNDFARTDIIPAHPA
jgi:ribonuclease VapC